MEAYGLYWGATKLRMVYHTSGGSKLDWTFPSVYDPLTRQHRHSIEFGHEKTVQPSEGLSVSIMPLSHGIHHQGISYESSAFFIDNDITNKSLLIFGDVEPDSVSGLSLNRSIWTVAAQRITERRLDSILIECSYCVSSRLLQQSTRAD